MFSYFLVPALLACEQAHLCAKGVQEGDRTGEAGRENGARKSVSFPRPNSPLNSLKIVSVQLLECSPASCLAPQNHCEEKCEKCR